MGGQPDIDFPEPTQEERDLQREQVEILRQQQQIIAEQARQQELLAPFLFESAGLQPILDDTGRVIDFQRVPPTEEETILRDLQLQALQQLTEPETADPLAAQRQEVEEALLQRSLQALAGELPIATGVEQELAEQERVLRARLQRQLGPGFETSTPGIEALARFGETEALIRDEARRGEITLAETLGLARGAANLGERAQSFGEGQQRLGNILAFERAGQVGNAARLQQLLAGQAGGLNPALQFSAGLGNTAAGFDPVLARAFQQRSGQFQGNLFAASQPTTLDELLNAGLLLGSSALAGGLGTGLFRGRNTTVPSSGGGGSAASSPVFSP